MSRKFAWGGLIACVLLIAATFKYPDVRFVVEKMATAAVMPYNWVVLILVALAVRGRQRQDRFVFLLAFVALLLQIGFGNGYVANWLIATLERDYSAIQPLSEPSCDVVVVLGGGTTEGRNGVAQANWAGDRVLLAARLFHAGKAKKLYCTGNRVEALSHDKLDPWEEAVQILVELGVPAEAIHHLDGRNTSEEMRSLAAEIGEDTRVGIVTSAYHMNRALRLAKANHVNAIALPCDFYTEAELAFNPIMFVPGPSASYVGQTALREYLARLLAR